MSKIVKEGFEIGGVILGQKCIYKGKEETIIGYSDNRYTTLCSIAVTDSSNSIHTEIQRSEYVRVYLEKYKDYTFDWVNLKDIELIPYKQPQQKEAVLEFEFKEAFDGNWLARVKYQNTDVLKRGEFKDKEIGVYSFTAPQYELDNSMCILGRDENLDSAYDVVSDEVKKLIEGRVKSINEKYGIPIDTEESILAEIDALPSPTKQEWGNSLLRKVSINKSIDYNYSNRRWVYDYCSHYNKEMYGVKYFMPKSQKWLDDIINRLNKVVNNK